MKLRILGAACVILLTYPRDAPGVRLQEQGQILKKALPVRPSFSAAASFETHRFAMFLRMRSENPHGEERDFARLEQ